MNDTYTLRVQGVRDDGVVVWPFITRGDMGRIGNEEISLDIAWAIEHGYERCPRRQLTPHSVGSSIQGHL